MTGRFLVAALTALVIAAALPGDARGLVCGRTLTGKTALSDDDYKLIFAGTIVSSRAVAGVRINRIRVDKVYRGSPGRTIDVRFYKHDLRRAGAEVGLALTGSKPYDSECGDIHPESLVRATTLPPAPLRRGRAAFIVAGRIARDGTLAALDERGRSLGYGFASTARERMPRSGRLAMCPGGERFLHVGEDIVVHRTGDLKPLSRRRLRPVRRETLVALRCLSPSGSDLAYTVTVHFADDQPAAYIDRAGARPVVIARGDQAYPGKPYALLGPSFALVLEHRMPREPAQLVKVDYATGARTVVSERVQLPVLGLSPDERRVAVFEERGGLGVIDLLTGEHRRVELADAPVGSIQWLDNERFVMVDSFSVRDPARIFRADLTPERSFALPHGVFTTVATAALFRVSRGGTLWRARPPQFTAQRLRILHPEPLTDFVTVPTEAPLIEASARRPER